MRTKPLPICVGNKVVGNVTGKVFHKTVLGSVHFLRVPPAICNDIAVLNAAKRAGATLEVVKDKETGLRYEATIADIDKFGWKINRGYGEQWALLIPRWKVTK